MTKKKINKTSSDITLDQTIAMIAQRTGVHIADVALVFDELCTLVKAEAATRRIDIGVGNLKMRDYGWREYAPGLLFVPKKKVLEAVREAMGDKSEE